MKLQKVKRSLTETLRRPRCRICVCASFEGFWTRFVMDRCRANTFWDYELTRRCHDAFYITTERGESQQGIIMKMYWKWALSLLVEHPMTKVCSAYIMLRRRFSFHFFGIWYFVPHQTRHRPKVCMDLMRHGPASPMARCFFNEVWINSTTSQSSLGIRLACRKVMWLYGVLAQWSSNGLQDHIMPLWCYK